MKRYAIAGTGSRGTLSYMKPLAEELKDVAQLVGCYDMNRKRAQTAVRYIGLDLPVFDDFQKMIDTTHPDAVIVTTVDATHSEYVVTALKAGCDVICEKPLATDGEKCRAILEAERQSGHRVRVTFNCRFMPVFVRVKELLKKGAVGEVYSVHFEWMLDTRHGADYFRRWHRRRENSGSLLIHKASHHFDLINWWLDDDPLKVNCFGSRRFYVPDHQEHGDRCSTCTVRNSCVFAMDLQADAFMKAFYQECEDEDGYFRDRCIFSDEIDIEDTVSVNMEYARGAVVSYSLTAHSPYEGMKVVINGSDGRLELTNLYSGIYGKRPVRTICVFNRLEEKIEYTFPGDEPVRTESEPGVSPFRSLSTEGHSGSDPLLREKIFRESGTDPLNQIADTRAGAFAMAIGAACNLSMAEDRAVYISDIL